MFNNWRPEKALGPSSGKEICQVCVCAQDGNIVYALKGGQIFLIDTISWKEQEILNAPPDPVLKMKTFGLRSEKPCGSVVNQTLVLVSTGTETGEHSLVVRCICSSFI